MWEMEGKIIGVVKDFNFKPLHTEIKPLILTPKAWPYTYLIVRIPSENYTSAIAYLGEVWMRISINSTGMNNDLERSLVISHALPF
jgi:putative ABC transport system permease protein